MVHFSNCKIDVGSDVASHVSVTFQFASPDDRSPWGLVSRGFNNTVARRGKRFQLSAQLAYNCTTAAPVTRQVVCPAFASASPALWQYIRTVPDPAHSGREHPGKGVIFEEDLEAYASQSGLPQGYGRLFIEALMGPSGRFLMQPDAAARQASFKKFGNFVNSREMALRKAFTAFDQDKDGKISIADLEGTLAYIAIACPKTRCIYRCRKQVVRQLMSRMRLDGQKHVAFDDFKQFFLLLPQHEMMVEYWLSARCASICDVDSKVRVHEDHKGSPWGHLFAGAVAGAASRTATAPLETLRLAAMAGTLPSKNLAVATSSILQTEGWKGLYKGNLLNVIRAAPQKALDFFAFDMYKQLIGSSSPAHTLVAAGLAGATSWIMLYPLEVVRSRITCDTCGQYKGIVHAFQTIVAKEGPQQLVRGLGPSVAAIIPEAAICYGLQDLLKQAYRKLHDGQEPSVPLAMGMGVFSAFMGQLVSFPMEVVSRRMQVGTCKQDLACVVRDLMKEGGLPAFYRGVGASTLRLVPMALVSFGAYEATRAMVMQMEDRQRKSEYEQQSAALLGYSSGQEGGACLAKGGPAAPGNLCCVHGEKCPDDGEGCMSEV